MRKNTSDDVLRPYTHCWLHTDAGDHYVGKISGSSYSEKTIRLTLSPVIRVIQTGNGPGIWRPISRLEICRFTFESCTTSERDLLHLKARSDLKDTIILLSGAVETKKIDRLIDEGSEPP